MNWLICSVGRRVNIVKWFREELNKRDKKLFATDQDEYSAGLYNADEYIVEPTLTGERLVEICQKNNITNILSLHDKQLLWLAKQRNYLKRERA